MNLMIDLETWGKTEQAVIRAAALVAFDDDGEKLTTRLIDARPSIDDQMEFGRIVDPDTIIWWSSKMPLSTMLTADETATPEYVVIARSTRDLIDAISEIYEDAVDLGAKDEKVWLWSRGRFDMQILGNLFVSQDPGATTPWRYWQERDARTLDSFVPKVDSENPHNPIADCYAQVAQVAAMYRLVAESA